MNNSTVSLFFVYCVSKFRGDFSSTLFLRLFLLGDFGFLFRYHLGEFLLALGFRLRIDVEFLSRSVRQSWIKTAFP